MDEFKQKVKKVCSPGSDRADENGRLETVLRVLKEKHDSSGGNCGLTQVKIGNKLRIPPDKLKEIIEVLKLQEKVTVHPGGQGEIIKLKV